MHPRLTDFIILLCLALTACSGTTQLSQNYPEEIVIPDKRLAEKQAWTKVAALSQERCGASLTPPAREEALGMVNCINRLVKTHVVPNALSPELVLQSRAEATALAEQYVDGVLSQSEYQQQAQRRSMNYKKEWSKLADKQELDMATRMWIGDRKI